MKQSLPATHSKKRVDFEKGKLNTPPVTPEYKKEAAKRATMGPKVDKTKALFGKKLVSSSQK